MNGITPEQLNGAFFKAFAELEHEIFRVRRRIASDQEKDRREYLESWITYYRSQQGGLLRLIGESGDGAPNPNQSTQGGSNAA
jgi:hypothetical protein